MSESTLKVFLKIKEIVKGLLRVNLAEVIDAFYCTFFLSPRTVTI